VTLRYGAHHLGQFRNALSRAHAMIFLCEHETQGIAYQEAMASNVPVLALDEGVLVDPEQKRFARSDLRVSSVPYFDATCGEPQRSRERTHFRSSELTQQVRIDLWSVGQTSRYPTCLQATIPLFDCGNHSSAPTWIPRDMASAGGQ
jgi:hypothetical protein